jgi:hypothetical protein
MERPVGRLDAVKLVGEYPEVTVGAGELEDEPAVKVKVG